MMNNKVFEREISFMCYASDVGLITDFSNGETKSKNNENQIKNIHVEHR